MKNTIVNAVSAVVLAATFAVGCSHSKPQPKAPTYVRRDARRLDIAHASFAVAPISVDGLPGGGALYEMILAASLSSRSRGAMMLQGAGAALAAAGHAPLTTADLAERLYNAAARGSADFPDEQALLADLVALAHRRSGGARTPELVVALRVRGLRRVGQRVWYRVTAAVYDVKRATLHTATSFTRETNAPALISELGNVGRQLLPRLCEG